MTNGFKTGNQLKNELMDAEGAAIRRKSREYFGFEVSDIRVIRVLTIDSDLDQEQLERIRTEIFTNPVLKTLHTPPWPWTLIG